MGVERKGKKYTPPDPNLTPEETRICFCYGVSEAQIREAIRAGARSIDAVRSDTCANTGCGGCQMDVEAILEDELSDDLG
jgi:NAD(P)H-nitrite reductase large subunit